QLGGHHPILERGIFQLRPLRAHNHRLGEQLIVEQVADALLLVAQEGIHLHHVLEMDSGELVEEVEIEIRQIPDAIDPFVPGFPLRADQRGGGLIIPLEYRGPIHKSPPGSFATAVPRQRYRRGAAACVERNPMYAPTGVRTSTDYPIPDTMK